jgi:hypothetical protein
MGMNYISVVFAIGLAVGFAVRICRPCGYLIATSSSRNEATLPSIAVGAEPSGLILALIFADGGTSRLVAPPPPHLIEARYARR